MERDDTNSTSDSEKISCSDGELVGCEAANGPVTVSVQPMVPIDSGLQLNRFSTR